MRLKSIDIQGFKSFADRIKLDFDDGITAVVGPNGSGKSNIADAVRWVLGEQSTRTLRGGKMEDVIFNGTQTRKGQGVASVTLLIDNNDHVLMSEGEEIAITRRLYRSGDSEYRINGTQVRLKDINELFMDTGIGRDGYSIIGQGRVAEIVSARSKERREIFEEAAGISRFRYRKTEAERQLASAEENMVRLRDILAELTARVGPLKEQSEKAKRFLELAQEKKTLEVSVWMNTLTALRQKAAQTEDKLLLAQADFSGAEALAKEHELAFTAEQEHGHVLMGELDALRSRLTDLSRQSIEWESQAAVFKNDIQHHTRSIEESQSMLGQAGRSKEELTKDLEQKRSEIAEKRQTLTTLTTGGEEISQKAQELARQQQQHSLQLESLKLQRGGVFEAIEAAKVDSASSTTILSESAARLSAMEQAEQQAEQALSLVEGERQDCKGLLVELNETLTSLQNSQNGYLLKRQSKQNRVDEFDQKLSAQDTAISEKLQRAKLLSDMDKSMEGFGQSVKHIMGQARTGALNGVIGPVSSLVRVQDKNVVAIETALGPAAQNIVVETQETAKRAIRQLQAAKAGRATFLPVDTVRGTAMDASDLELQEGFVGVASSLVSCDPKFTGLINWLLGRIIIAEDLDCATAMAKKSGYRFRVVTLDGQVVNAGGSLTGGFTARSAGILGRGAEIDRLQREAKELGEKRKTVAQERESAARELGSVDAELFAIEAQQKTCGEDKIRCEAELKAVEQKEVQAKKQREDIAAERALLTNRVTEIKAKSINLQELKEKLAQELELLQQQISDGGELRDSLLQQREELLQRQSQQSSQVMMAQRDADDLNQQAEQISLMITSKEQQREETQTKLLTLAREIETATQGIAQLSERAQQSRGEEQSVQEAIAAGMAARNESERRCTVLRESEKEQLAKRDGLYREVVRLTEQKSSADGEFEGIVAKLFDEYELTRSDAEELAQPIEDIHAANRRLTELRTKIKNLGSVNVGAIDEYSEVALRYETLTRQIQDVEKAKNELTRLIGDLTLQMCDIFKTKFEQINQNFSKVFVELFGGGSAKLTLNDPDNLLESGIEIAVSPPGKVIRNLASLSGGEQAFVAIAIFFAILKVNPSPFCLMDEIEAALDDVNVSKFAAYLHTMTQKTQFIAITHRRGTMEEADVLYGVTMQEEGVSKLLRLQVSELEKNFAV